MRELKSNLVWVLTPLLFISVAGLALASGAPEDHVEIGEIRALDQPLDNNRSSQFVNQFSAMNVPGTGMNGRPSSSLETFNSTKAKTGNNVGRLHLTDGNAADSSAPENAQVDGESLSLSPPQSLFVHWSPSEIRQAARPLKRSTLKAIPSEIKYWLIHFSEDPDHRGRFNNQNVLRNFITQAKPLAFKMTANRSASLSDKP